MDQDGTWHGGMPQPRRLCVRWGPRPLPKRGQSPLSNFRPISIVDKTAGCIKMPLGIEVGLSPRDFVLDGNPSPSTKRVRSLPLQKKIGPCLLWPNGWMDQGGTWHEGTPQLGDFVLDGDPVPLPKKGTEPTPQFSAHFYCGQTAGCIKMPLGMEVGLSPGDFVLDGDSAPCPKTGRTPNFWPMSIVAKRLDG